MRQAIYHSVLKRKLPDKYYDNFIGESHFDKERER